MIVKAYPPRMTPEQFEELSDSKGLELINGVVVEKNMGAENGGIQSLISYYLNLVVLPNKLGRVIDSEGMFQCFSNPKQLRKPDVSFIFEERLPDGRLPRGICKVRPDIAVEVVSPNDLYEGVEEKVADYFDAGVPLVWIVTPKTRTVLVYRADGTARRLRNTDELTADPVIAGVRIRIADLFLDPPEAPATADATEPPAAS